MQRKNGAVLEMTIWNDKIPLVITCLAEKNEFKFHYSLLRTSILAKLTTQLILPYHSTYSNEINDWS